MYKGKNIYKLGNHSELLMANKNLQKYSSRKAQDEAQIEQEFLKGIKDQELGIYCDLFSAKSDISGQNGGVVTSLLMKGLSKGMFDAAVVIKPKRGYDAEAVIARTASEVAAARGTKYLKVQAIPKLRELIRQGAKRVVIVCTPCEVLAARRVQQAFKNECEVTIVGLFCFEAFNQAKLKDKVEESLGVDLDKAEKTEIRHRKFTVQVDDRYVSCKVRDLESAVEEACRYCDDFTARLADISVGSIGSKPGYSTVVVRSEAGKKLVKNLDCIREAVDKEEIVKLSKSKKKRAKESFIALSSLK
jgi:coenzyme F420-reducing hydrogenase beta subunit